MSDTPQTGPAKPSWIRTLVDFGALLAFVGTFLVARARGIEGSEATIVATWGLVAGSAVALTVGWLVEKRLAFMPALAGGFALVFGALTIVLHDADIIKIKITVMNGFLSALLIGGTLLGKQPIKALFGDSLVLPDSAWRTLTLRYGAYFGVCAVLNEIVWRTQSDDVYITMFRPALWVGALVFAVFNMPLIMRSMKSAETPPPPSPDPGM